MKVMTDARNEHEGLVEIRDLGRFPMRYSQNTGLWDPFDPPRWLRWLGVRPQKRE